MDLRNKVLLYLLLIGYLGVMIAAGIKIGDNPNAGTALVIAMTIKFSAIGGLLWYNFPKLKGMLKRTKPV